MIRGAYGGENFDFVRIRISGCNLGAEECHSKEEVAQQTFNVITLKAIPNILGEDKKAVKQYT